MEDEGWNTWYYHNSLPAPLGIRVVVRDKDYNYAVADTQLLIIDDLDDMPEPVEPDDPNDPGDLPSLCPVELAVWQQHMANHI